MPKTVTLLPARLKKIPRSEFKTEEHYEAAQQIVTRAEREYYHDRHSPLARPKIVLAADLERVGLHDIAEDVREGAYD